jgi:galactose mutarotase-like enzyme
MTSDTTTVLRSEAVEVVLTPGKGGDLVSVRHVPTAQEVLARTPWFPSPRSPVSQSDPALTWLERYPGGWQLLFPNAGAACEHAGGQHSFHGEASVAPWDVADLEAAAVTLRRRFFVVPVEFERRITVEDDLVVVRESASNTSDEPVEVMWGHHPGFGGDLLAGAVALATNAQAVHTDPAYDVAGNALAPGHSGPWPLVPGTDGSTVDLRTPLNGQSCLAYLDGLPSSAWASICRRDGALGVALSWSSEHFPCAWLWQELGGTRTPPWSGRGRVVGLEPCSSWPGNLATAARAGAQLVLEPGGRRDCEVRLHVFSGVSNVSIVGPDGRVGT